MEGDLPQSLVPQSFAMRVAWSQRPPMHWSAVHASASAPQGVPSVAGTQRLPLSTSQGPHPMHIPLTQAPEGHVPVPHVKQPLGDCPHMSVPQSFGTEACPHTAALPSRRQLSIVQGLRSSQSTGALRTQRSDTGSQLQVPPQGSWFRR